MLAKPSMRRGKTSTKDRINSSAKALFTERGYEGASLDEIARGANVSKPTLYSHFGSKERLFLSILEETFDRIAEPLLGVDVDGQPIDEVLTAHSRAYARAVLDSEMLALNRLIVAEAGRFPSMARQYYRLGPSAVYSAIAKLLQRRVSAGEINCENCLVAARMYGAMVVSPYRLQLQLLVDEAPDWEVIDKELAIAIQIFVAGLRKR